MRISVLYHLHLQSCCSCSVILLPIGRLAVDGCVVPPGQSQWPLCLPAFLLEGVELLVLERWVSEVTVALLWRYSEGVCLFLEVKLWSCSASLCTLVAKLFQHRMAQRTTCLVCSLDCVPPVFSCVTLQEKLLYFWFSLGTALTKAKEI